MRKEGSQWATIANGQHQCEGTNRGEDYTEANHDQHGSEFPTSTSNTLNHG